MATCLGTIDVVCCIWKFILLCLLCAGYVKENVACRIPTVGFFCMTSRCKTVGSSSTCLSVWRVRKQIPLDVEFIMIISVSLWIVPFAKDIILYNDWNMLEGVWALNNIRNPELSKMTAGCFTYIPVARFLSYMTVYGRFYSRTRLETTNNFVGT